MINELALFAGAGGGILGGYLMGWRTVCAVEIEDYPRRVLLARQRDGILPRFPIWDDIRTFDGHPWRGRVDVVTGGFPCQDISVAGKGAGIEGEKSGLWKEMARVIGEVRPRFALVENSPVLTSRGLGRVLGDLAEMGYDARWGVLGSRHTGGPSHGERIWIVAATTNQEHGKARLGVHEKHNREEPLLPGNNKYGFADEWWRMVPPNRDGRMDTGVSHRVDRLKAIGNGQVPAVAKLAWEVLSGVDGGGQTL